MITKMMDCVMMRVLERGRLMPYSLCQYSRNVFRRGGGKPDVDRGSDTVVLHTTTCFKPPYMMYVWVDLNLNRRISIHYTTDSGFGYHKSVLCRVLTDGMILVLENGAPTSVNSYYEALLKKFIFLLRTPS